MKVLTIDIETSPSLAYVWKMFQNDVSLSQLETVTEVMCFAAKWLDSKKVEFYSTHHHGKQEMVEQAHRLLTEADAVVHFNGTTFDMPHLNREFLLAGMNPPAPYKQIDLLRAVKSNFRFMSNKLAHVTEQLQLSGKLSHTGFQMWRDALAGDEKAWALFKRYNIQDVRTTEELYHKLRPWIHNHPSVALDHGVDGCNRCGSQNLQKRGYDTTSQGKYQRLQCQDCGGWLRSGKRLDSVDLRGIR